MVGWHHRFGGHESEQAPGHGEGQGGLACCGPWGCKEFRHDLATEQQHMRTYCVAQGALLNGLLLLLSRFSRV